MKLYREVLIESAEQAEALPIGTLAAPMYEDGPDFVYALVRREETYEPWCNSDGSHARGHGDLDGFAALVPIEAEEVHVTARGLLELDMHGRPDVNHDVTDPRLYQRTEWHTPWERQN